MASPTPGAGAQLFVSDPIDRLKPAKDSSVALMQAAARAGRPVWVATPADLIAADRIAVERPQAAGGHGVPGVC